MKKITKVVWLRINPDADGLDGLYIDGQLVEGGDWYHDKAAERIDAFLKGLEFMGWSGTVEYKTFEGDDIWELPETLTK